MGFGPTSGKSVRAGYCKVYRSVSQVIPANVSPYPAFPVVMQTLAFRSSDAWTLSDGGILVPKAGIYNLIGYTQWQSGSNEQQLCLTVDEAIVTCKYTEGISYGANLQICGLFELGQNSLVKLCVRCAGTVGYADLAIAEIA